MDAAKSFSWKKAYRDQYAEAYEGYCHHGEPLSRPEFLWVHEHGSNVNALNLLTKLLWTQIHGWPKDLSLAQLHMDSPYFDIRRTVSSVAAFLPHKNLKNVIMPASVRVTWAKLSARLVTIVSVATNLFVIPIIHQGFSSHDRSLPWAPR